MSSDMFEDFLWALDHGHKQARRRNARRGKCKPAVRPLADETPTSSPAEPPTDWDGIAVGHAVLAAEEDDPNTWYLAQVVGQQGDDLLQLRWGGEWAEEPLFLRRREHLALLPPDLAAVVDDLQRTCRPAYGKVPLVCADTPGGSHPGPNAGPELGSRAAWVSPRLPQPRRRLLGE